MSLPKHNPVLKGLYFLTVIVMFTFMIMVIKAYWPEDNQMAQWDKAYYQSYSEPNDAVSYKPTVMEETSAAAQTTATANESDVVNRAERTIIGLPFTLSLDRPIASQMNQLWQDFYNASGLQHQAQIKSKSEVYLVYVSHDSQDNSIELVLGYQSKTAKKHTHFQIVEIPSGTYLKRESVLNTWNNANNLSVYLNYQNDYEVYTLDSNYNVLSQVAYVSIKS